MTTAELYHYLANDCLRGAERRVRYASRKLGRSRTVSHLALNEAPGALA